MLAPRDARLHRSMQVRRVMAVKEIGPARLIEAGSILRTFRGRGDRSL
jgi:hypothetical protein